MGARIGPRSARRNERSERNYLFTGLSLPGPETSARRLGVGRMDHHLALRSDTDAFGADAGNRVQREVDDAALAGVHGIHFEGLARDSDPFGRGARHHLQLFDAQGAVAGAVEEDLVLP